MSRKVFLPTDIYAIKEMGLKTWQDHYYWPISDDIFFGLLDKIWSEFDKLYDEIDDLEKDLIICDTYFVSFLAQYLHSKAVRAYSAKENMDVLIGGLSKQFYEPVFSELSKAYKLHDSLVNGLKSRVKGFMKKIVFNRHVKVMVNIEKLFQGSDTWGLGSYGHLKEVYLKSANLYCDHIPVQKLLTGSPHSWYHPDFSTLGNSMLIFLEELHTYCEEFFGFVFDITEIKDCWLKRIDDLSSIYQAICNRSRLPHLLLLSEVAKPIHKTIAMAVRSKGSQVVGFHHGNDMGNIRIKSVPYSLFYHCDTYVYPTAKSADLYEKNYLLEDEARIKNIVFESAETIHYKTLHESCVLHPFPDKFKTIMIMGYPMNSNRYQYSTGDFFMFQLDLELRISVLLRKHNYYVIYKMHPERRQEAEGIFNGFADEILIDPFESVFQAADAFFFGCITSTTFGFALCTNKPVFVMDIDGLSWNHEAYGTISRRCIMIPAFFNDNNRIEFDEDFLLEKLRLEPKEPDFTYVERFMYPAGSVNG